MEGERLKRESGRQECREMGVCSSKGEGKEGPHTNGKWVREREREGGQVRAPAALGPLPPSSPS